MEDLFGIVVFVIFAVVSLASKVMRRKEEKAPAPAPKWPGPVAGPGVPGFPRPAWPEGPRQAAPPAPRQTPAVARQTPPQYEIGEGRSGGEGVGSGMEGSGGMEGPSAITADAIGFTKENYQFGSLDTTSAVPVVSAGPVGVTANLQGAFADRSSVARAVIMSEVLGKPKGRRRR